ncbi:MAG TPA: hypothetical protein VJ576_02270 [Rhodocyclaceae bacterium]|nr:hypothetical protein [Rhodocyclaceae bacterium]
MKIQRSAWSAFKSGATSRQLKEAAHDKAGNFLFWLVLTVAALCLLPVEWAVGPAVLAVLNGIQSFDASKLAPDIEVLENLLRRTSSR